MKSRFTAKKKARPSLGGVVLPVLLFIAIVGLFYYGLMGVERTSREEQLLSVERAVTKATVQCYAIEGRYPPNLEYLEENYGLTLDRERYIIQYDAFASNIMPTILVLPMDLEGVENYGDDMIDWGPMDAI